MKGFLKGIIIFLVLFSEVRVRATSHEGHRSPLAADAKSNIESYMNRSPIDLPGGCLKNIEPYIQPQENSTEIEAARSCSIFARANSLRVDLPSAQIQLAKGASLKVEDGGIHLIRGKFLVTARESLKVSSLFSDFSLSQGESIFEVTDSKVDYTAIVGLFEYRPKGEQVYHRLPEGYSTFSSYITSSGVALTGFPRPAEIDRITRLWASFVSKSEATEFKEKLNTFLSKWHGVSQTVGGWYVDTVQREIASLRAEEQRQAELRAKQEKENFKYRNMFRDRVFGRD